MRLIANILLGELVIVIAVLAATVTLVPAIHHTIPVNISAGSMTGTLDYGDLLYIDPENKAPKVGEIVTFRFGQQQPVSHRVVAIVPDDSGWGIAYETKGDFNLTPDERHVVPAEIIGVGVTYWPAIGLILNLLSKTPIQLFIMLIAFALYMIGTTPRKSPLQIRLERYAGATR